MENMDGMDGVDKVDDMDGMDLSGRPASSMSFMPSTPSMSSMSSTPSMPSAEVLLLAWGNLLRRDDGVGWAVARAVRESDISDQIKVIEAQQLTPELAEDIQRSRRVIFVDAGTEGAPGSVRCQRVEPTRDEAAALTHHCAPATLLALAKELYGAAPEATVVEIVGEDFGVGEGLSERVRRAIPEALERIRSLARIAATR
ncbi:MAG: hydrogenase maturation protease [Candidatus Sumerlaeota bacterium]|nr:hydrogenase maturation protease [Candidatus Sumerlaeota bacterium]